MPFWVELSFASPSSNSSTSGPGSLLKALRMFRLLKLSRQYDGSIVIYKALKLSLAALGVPFFFLTVAVIVFSSIIYYLEALFHVGPPTFRSIPHAIWFMLVTMTTVGYGDVSPSSEVGKAVTVCAMLFGVLFLSMPLGASEMLFGVLFLSMLISVLFF